MKSPVVMIGIGEIGSVIARGCMRLGYPIIPVTRDMDMNAVAEEVAEPEMVVVAVGGKYLHPTLEKLPAVWADKIVLIQNELLPRDWQAHDLNSPTVISVWFEKKKGMDSKVVTTSPVFGAKAQLLKDALGTLDIPVRIVDNEADLLNELVVKNLYILTTNIAGLKVGGNVHELWNQHKEFASKVVDDVLEIQTHLTGEKLDEAVLIAGMLAACAGDPEHGCMGRSAPARLERALGIADEAGLKVPTMREIAQLTA